MFHISISVSQQGEAPSRLASFKVETTIFVWFRMRIVGEVL